VARLADVSAVDGRQNYNRIVCLDLNLGAFYYYTVTTGLSTVGIPFINGIISVSNPLTSSTDPNQFFYLVTDLTAGTTYDMTFARERRADLNDWTRAGSTTAFETYFVTGYKLHGEAFRKWQSNYILVYSNFEEDNSCFMQGIWDYADSEDSNRWTTAQQVCFTEEHTAVQVRRLKIRGWGLALQFRFESDGTNPFHILGWSVFESANSGP
jgi:hypothetical protein